MQYLLVRVKNTRYDIIVLFLMCIFYCFDFIPREQSVMVFILYFLLCVL